METLGQKIKLARIKKKLKQSELAKKVKVAQGTVSAWEKDLFAPDGLLLLELIKILGMEILPDDVRATILPVNKDFERPTYTIYDEVSSLRREVEELRKAILISTQANNNSIIGQQQGSNSKVLHSNSGEVSHGKLVLSNCNDMPSEPILTKGGMSFGIIDHIEGAGL